MTVSIEVRDSTATVLVEGDVDLATAPAMTTAIGEAIDHPGVAEIVVDLTGVPFLDSSGISALLRGRRGAVARDLAYRVSGADRRVREVLEVTGVWTLLTVPTG